MNSRNNVMFRLELARGFLAEAEQDYLLKRWRSCVDNSQLSVENSGKTILAVFGITSKTHEPSKVISNLIHSGLITGETAQRLRDLLPDMLALGADEHFMTDYGDEMTMTLPWELFKEESSKTARSKALSLIKKAGLHRYFLLKCKIAH